MSCKLTTVAQLDVPPDVQRWLCPTSSASSPVQEQQDPLEAFPASTWDDNWGGWDNADDTSKKQSSPLAQNSGVDGDWLTLCHVSVTDAADTMALSCGNRLCVLTGLWEVPEEQEERLVLRPTWRGELQPDASRITCVLCLPIASLQRSSAGAPDFTAILVAKDSGTLSWYTQDGCLLLERRYCEVGVVSVTLRGDCLAVLYPECVVTIQAMNLATMLRICIAKLAKASAGGSSAPPTPGTHQPPLPHQKWHLSTATAMASVAVAGTANESLYDAMAHATLSDVPFNRDATVAGLHTGGASLVCVGQDPYLACVSARETHVQVHVTDVAKQLAAAVTTKVLGAASSWLPFVGTKPAEETVQEKVAPGVHLPYRWCLPEPRRCGASVSVSPHAPLAAVTDNFGRVVLVDTRAGLAVRCWKGYRDAGVGWVSSSGASSNGTARRAVFVVLYAPRRGLLEVWPAQGGTRIGAYNVPRHSRLLYTNFSMVGNSDSSLLLLGSDGRLQKVEVPFHLALGGRTAGRARESHLLRSFKAAVRSCNEKEAVQLCGHLHTTHGRLQALLFLAYSPSSYSDYLLREVIKLLLPQYLPRLMPHYQFTPDTSRSNTPSTDTAADPAAAGPAVDDAEAGKLIELLHKLHQLLQLYAALYALHPKEPQLVDEEPPVQLYAQELSLRLGLGRPPLDDLIRRWRGQQQHQGKVRFSTSPPAKRVNVAWFLRSFQLIGAGGGASDGEITGGTVAQRLEGDYSRRTVVRPTPTSEPAAPRETASPSPPTDGSQAPIPVHLQAGLSADRRRQLGVFLFGWPFTPARATALHTALDSSGLQPKPLLRLLMQHYNNDNNNSNNSNSNNENNNGNDEMKNISCDVKRTTAHVTTSDISDVMTTPSSSSSSSSDDVTTAGAPPFTPLQEAELIAALKMATLLASLTSLAEHTSELQGPPTTALPWGTSIRSRLASSTCVRRSYVTAMAATNINRKMEVRLEQWSMGDRVRGGQEVGESDGGADDDTAAADSLVDTANPTTDAVAATDDINAADADTSTTKASTSADPDFATDADATADADNVIDVDTADAAAADAAAADTTATTDAISPSVTPDLYCALCSDVSNALRASSSSSSHSTAVEWEESTSIEGAEWAVLINQLSQLLPLEQLLETSVDSRHRADDSDATVKLLLDKGKGAVSEFVSRWLVRSGLSSEHLTMLLLQLDAHMQQARGAEQDAVEEDLSDAEDSEDSDGQERPPAAVVRDTSHWPPHLATVYESLLAVAAVFPNSMCLGSLAPCLSWELAAAWQRCHQDAPLLQAAATVAATIPNCHTKHGVCVLIWEKWVSAVVRRFGELVERCSGVPSSHACSTRLRVPRHALLPCIEAARQLLILIMESNVRCEAQKAHIPNVDTFWQHMRARTRQKVDDCGGDKYTASPAITTATTVTLHQPATVDHAVHHDRFIGGDGRDDCDDSDPRVVYGPKSLVEVSVLQKKTSYDLAFLHLQLLDAISLVLRLDMSGVRVNRLFSDKARCVVHQSLHLVWTAGSADQASSVATARLSFLTTALTLALAGLPDQPTWEQFHSCGAAGALALGQLWGVARDHLCRYQVVELYSHGHDNIAKQVGIARVIFDKVAS